MLFEQLLRGPGMYREPKTLNTTDVTLPSYLQTCMPGLYIYTSAGHGHEGYQTACYVQGLGCRASEGGYSPYIVY